MCLLIVAPAGHNIDRDAIRTSAASNNDGYGFAIATKTHGILRGRGMELESVCDWFYQLRDMHPDANALFHLRWTTHGRTDRDNCHPFLVAGRDDIVLGHNGILPIDVPRHEHRSDTRIFAEDWLSEWGVGVLDDASFMADLGVWARGSKLAVLADAPDLRSDLYIVNEDDGHWSDGCWWSNYSYVRSQPSTASTHQYGWHDDDLIYVSSGSGRVASYSTRTQTYTEQSYDDFQEVKCWHCNHVWTVDVGEFSTAEDDYCPMCDACAFCGDDRGVCRCGEQYESLSK